MQRKIICIVFSILLCNVFGVVSLADNSFVQPRTNNVNTVITDFEISSDGVALVDICCVGYNGITQGMKITTKIQKYESGSWNDVNIGVENNEWIDTSNLVVFTTTHSVKLTSKGTYRALVSYEIWGSGGATDYIEKEIEKTY